MRSLMLGNIVTIIIKYAILIAIFFAIIWVVELVFGFLLSGTAIAFLVFVFIACKPLIIVGATKLGLLFK